MKQIHRIVAQLVLGVGLLIGATGAQASTIVSDSKVDDFATVERLRPGFYTNQLTDWLGKGSLTLTSIFNLTDWQDANRYGGGSRRWHFPINAELDAVLSGKGPTITLMNVTANGVPGSMKIGWYNPVNGVTDVGGNAGESAYDSFIFNLTTNRVLRPDDPDGESFVSNYYAGTDILLTDTDKSLISAFSSFDGTYSDSFHQPLLWDRSSQFTPRSELFVTSFSVYSISVDALASAVPESGSWAMMIVGFGMIGGAARYRRRKTTTYA